MKKLLLLILLLLAFATTSLSADWYACGTTPAFNHVSGTTVSDVWNSAGACNATWMDWSTQPGTGDNFYANAVTGIVVNVDPAGTAGATIVNLLTTAGAGTAGGTFTYNVSINLAMKFNCTAGTTACIAVSGTTGTGSSTTGTCTGSATVATMAGCSDSHNVTGGTMTYGAAVGGVGGSSAYGINYTASNTGTPVIVNTCTGASTVGTGIGCNASGANMQVGNCVAMGSVGCNEPTAGSGAITVTGNLIWSLNASAIYGRMYWVPASAQNYIKLPTTSAPTYLYASQAPALSNVLSTASEVLPTSGVWTAGTATAGGGGSSVGY